MKQVMKGTCGYLDQHKKNAWIKAAIMLSIPVVIFLAAWLINKDRNNVMTVVAIVGCLPGCNQVVQAIVASRYHSIDKGLFQETEQARGDRLALYDSVMTSYERTFYIDCIVISGRDVVGYTSDPKTDPQLAAEHIRTILKKNSYKQNVKIFAEKKAFLERVRSLSAGQPEEVPFRGDDRYEGLTRDEIIQGLLMAISL